MRVFVLVISLTVLSCAGRKATSSEQKTSSKYEQRIYKVIYDPDYNAVSDPCVIEAAEAVGKVLAVTVRYAGGCRPHGFQLFTDGAMMKSLPPKMNFFLKHDSAGDSCEKETVETIRFDLEEVIPPGQVLVIKLQGLENEEIRVK